MGLGAQELRLAVRRLGKSPGATFASIAALACGIGAAAATWSLLSAVLLKPLAVEEPDRLFQVDRSLPSPLTSIGFAPTHTYQELETILDSSSFERVAASGISASSPLVTERGDIPQQRSILFVNREFFATLGVSAALGRTFTGDEDRRGAPLVAVLSGHYWQRVFNADPAVLGRSVRVGDTPVTIVGILPRRFRGLNLAEAPDLFLPLHSIDDVVASSMNNHLGGAVVEDSSPVRASPARWIRIVGRLRRNDTPAIAEARLNAALGSDVVLTSVNTAAIPAAARAGMVQFTTLLLTTVGLLLLTGCLTVGMLLLVRTEDRRDELGVCLALGASRLRLACGIAAEAAVLCALGALLAVPFTWWLFSGLRAFQLPGQIDVELLGLSGTSGAWLVAAGAALAVTCVVALLATLVGLGAKMTTPVQSRTIAASHTRRRGLRTTLVAAQVAITLVLATGAGLFTRSLAAALALNPGIDTARVITVDVSLREHGYTAERATIFFDELLDRLRHSGLIGSVAITRLVGGTITGGRITVDGAEIEVPSVLSRMAVDDEYFSTVGLPIVNGREFSAFDRAGSPPVAIVSESFGRLIAGGGSPIGHRITNPVDSSDVREIIGVARDLITDINSTEPLIMYSPLAQAEASLSSFTANAPRITLVFRAAGDSSAARREVAAAIRALDAQVWPGLMVTLDEQIGRQMNPQRFAIYVLSALGGIALLLAVLGTYVMAESMVIRRRRELGVRAALGASGTHLGGLVLGDTVRLVGIGLAAGLMLAFLGAGLIRSLLYQVEPLDPVVLTSVSVGILGLALIVSLRPALEAMRLDLTRSLREE